ncbi:MAG: hypothetical protein AAGG51_19760 [Cyanobacteria bacterium P01_G01_bin.54]
MISRFRDSTKDHFNFRSWSESGKGSNDTPFFSGEGVEVRMKAIRPKIREVRQSWNNFEDYISSLRQFLLNSKQEKRIFQKEKELHLFDTHLNKFRDWIDRDNRSEKKSIQEDYGAVQFYTSRNGYELIFKAMNEKFRDKSKLSEDDFKNLAFLVELLNIDLYNYNELNPGVSVFRDSDRVYRGLDMSQDEFKSIMKFMTDASSVQQRYISTPLGFLSTSLNRDVAVNFSGQKNGEGEQSSDKQGRCSVILEIHIISLDPDLLGIYQDRHPSSIVSPICATRIEGLSRYPQEREVLLRGPFFQVLDVKRADASNIVELMMLDCNRDHPTTAALSEEEDKSARYLFRTLVHVNRYEYCKNFYLERNRKDEVDRYQNALNASKRILDKLL